MIGGGSRWERRKGLPPRIAASFGYGSAIKWFKTLTASAVKDFEQQNGQRMQKQQQKQLLHSFCFLEGCVCENYQQGHTLPTQRQRQRQRQLK
ncbi:hypothetical protein ACFX2I_022782 [Malus domestica]|uniref:Uncharacterized protein n=1 Tax=Malus domestica TaxID=3750 RepID=A0A498HKW3_MALDO|nr:hypothetical protein DVH24_015566 [Malus domestica]